jgi:hypothetical protein
LFLAGGESFDDAEFEALVLFDVEVGGVDVVDGAAAEVFFAERDGDAFNEPLECSYGPVGGRDVVAEQEQAAGS